tara:strand:- start:726 stop:1649 length:924 start_codon:yes stop_codon:yes gene_type:complete
MSHLQINSIEIFNLALFMIPNLIYVTLPFLIIFGFVLSFLKLSRDKEIIGIYSIGLSIGEIRKPILLITLISIILSLFLSFFFSPFTYDMYKKKEFNLRHSINFDKIDFSNFIKFNKNLTIDFENVNGEFENILINITANNEIIMFSKKGEITQNADTINFKLIDGFKTEIKNDDIENLKFDTYLASFPLDEKKIYSKNDPNALNLFELLNSNDKKNKIIIYLRLIDTLIIISLSLYFYYNIIKKNDYTLINKLFFIFISMICVLIDNLFESYVYENFQFILILLINILIIHLFPNIIKLLRIGNEI